MSLTIALITIGIVAFYFFHRSIIKADWQHKYENYLKSTKDNPVKTLDEFKQFTEDDEL